MSAAIANLRRALAASWRVLLAYGLFTAWGFGCLLASIYLTLNDAKLPVHLADGVMAQVLAILAAGAVGHVAGTIGALLRPRLWLAAAAGVGALMVAGLLVPATGPIGPFLVVAGVAAMGGYLAVGSGEIFASWVPLTYSVGAAVLWMNTHGKVSLWLTGAKFAVWDAVTFAFLSGAVVLFLVYLLQRHALALALWQAGSRPGAERLDLHARAGRGSWAVLAGVAGVVLIATALLSPFLFRTRLEQGSGRGQGRQPPASAPRGPASVAASTPPTTSAGGTGSATPSTPPAWCAPAVPGEAGDPACAGQHAPSASASATAGAPSTPSGAGNAVPATRTQPTAPPSTAPPSTAPLSTAPLSAAPLSAAPFGPAPADPSVDGAPTENAASDVDTDASADDTLPPPPDLEQAAKRSVDAARLGLHVMAWLVALCGLLLLLAIFSRPLRRAVVLRHLVQPLWRTTPTRRIHNLWLRALIALDDIGVRAHADESPQALARRAGDELGREQSEAPVGLQAAAQIIERLEYAGRGVQPADEAHMREAVRALAAYVAHRTSLWRKLVQGWAIIAR